MISVPLIPYFGVNKPVFHLLLATSCFLKNDKVYVRKWLLSPLHPVPMMDMMMIMTMKRRTWFFRRYEIKECSAYFSCKLERPGCVCQFDVWAINLSTSDPNWPRQQQGGHHRQGSHPCHVQPLRWSGVLFLLSLNLSLSTHPSTCPFLFVFWCQSLTILLFPCLLSEWWAECQTAPEAPEWQVPSWWVDSYHACFQIIQNPNSQVTLGIWVFFASTIHRNLERLWFGYLREHDSYCGCILKRKIQMLNFVFLVLQIRKSKWNHNTLIRSYVLLVSSVFFGDFLNVQRPTKGWQWPSLNSQLSGRRWMNTR